MNWKYWDAREDWVGPRSYVLERNNALLAHVGIWPVTLLNSRGEPVRGVHLIDWAAADNSPGAGILLAQKLGERFDFIYCIGGSEMTQKLLPPLGFNRHIGTWQGARPLRAMRQVLSHPDRNWKLPPRLVRNLFWSVYPIVTVRNGWRVEAATPQQSADLLSSISGESHYLPRSEIFLEYLLRCPNAVVQLQMVHDARGPRGVLALARVRRQVRLAGLWLREPDDESLRQTYILAQKSAAQVVEAYEFVALGTQGPSAKVATSSGLRLWEGPVVYLQDKKRQFSGGCEFQLCDNDAFFSDSGRVSYWT